jgi:hypothetical protein
VHHWKPGSVVAALSLSLSVAAIMAADVPVKRRIIEPDYFSLGFRDHWVQYTGCQIWDPNDDWACATAQRAFRLRVLQRVRAAGFDTIYTVLAPLPHGPDASQAFLDAAWNSGTNPMRAIPLLILNGEECCEPDDPHAIGWANQITAYRCHPALYAWELYDDVDRIDPRRCTDQDDPNAATDPNFCHCPETVGSHYDGFFDPHGTWGPTFYRDPGDPNCPGYVPKPIFNGGGWQNRIRAYLDAMDVYMPQVYAFLPGGCTLGDVDTKLAIQMHNAASSDDPNEWRPVIAVLQTYRFHWYDPNNPNDPNAQSLPDVNDPQITVRQVRNMAYQALLNGVIGISYYSFYEYEPVAAHTYINLDADTPAMQAHRAVYATIATQVHTLQPVLNNGTLVKIDTGNPNIRASYWIYNPANPNDPFRLYVVAVNVDDAPQPADIPLPTAKADNYLSRMFDRPTPSDPGLHFPALNDANAPPNLCGTMGPESVHVYRCHLPTIRPADMNCDGHIDARDYDAYVLATLDAATWKVTYPSCSILNGDTNGDGVLDDLATFMAYCDPNALPTTHLSDMNCDGHIDPNDYAAYVLALTAPDTWLQLYPGCTFLNGDTNGDGLLDDVYTFLHNCDPNALPPGCPGDMNCDGVFDMTDVNAFVLALSRPLRWMTDYIGCTLLNGDINLDETCDMDDINPFVDFLIHHSNTLCP